jgi:hypothetical protein
LIDDGVGREAAGDCPSRGQPKAPIAFRLGVVGRKMKVMDHKWRSHCGGHDFVCNVSVSQ